MNVIIDKVESLIEREKRKYIPDYLKELEDIKETLYKSLNLCSTCTLEQPTCNGKIVQFGIGLGKDNIVRCQTYKLKI